MGNEIFMSELLSIKVRRAIAIFTPPLIPEPVYILWEKLHHLLVMDSKHLLFCKPQAHAFRAVFSQLALKLYFQ